MTPESNPLALYKQAKEQGLVKPQEKAKPAGNPLAARKAEREAEKPEGLLKSSVRTAAQYPLGAAEATGPGLVAGGLHFLGLGEVLDPEEMERIKEISEREGVPFNEEKYKEAAQNALDYFPTVANIAREVEKKTGIPLEPKEWYQKALRLASGVGTGLPGSVSQKIVAGTTAAGVSQGLQKAGVPEPFADLLGITIGGVTGTKSTPFEASLTKKKPSGLTERQFEGISKPTEVTQKKLESINKKVESDFRDISDKIIKESPVGETFNNLKNDPEFKQASRELMAESQKIADSLPGEISKDTIVKEYTNIANKELPGFESSEFDKSYQKFMKEAESSIHKDNATYGDLVEQYRKNNKSLGEYYEPGASKALNNAKKEALLDRNKAIANLIEKGDPELGRVFKEGNARWTKIMDAEAVDSFINEVFDGKIDFNKIEDFFEKNGYDRIFKRSLGQEGFEEFETLLKDMLTSKKGYKNLKVAKEQGWKDLAMTSGAYIIDPALGHTKLGLDILKRSYKTLMNSMLDKPKLAFTLRKGFKELEAGNFKAANKYFQELYEDIKDLNKPILL